MNQYQGAYGYGYPQTQSPYTGATPGYTGYPYTGATPGAPGLTYQPQQVPQTPFAGAPAAGVPGMLPVEESYIENILRLNKGKIATVYMSFENSAEWGSKVFRGVIEAAGRDHIILSDPQTGRRYLLLMLYLDYVTFDEEIEYEYPYAAVPPR